MSIYNSFRSIMESYAKGVSLDDKPELINLFTPVSGVRCVTDTRGRTVYRALPAEEPKGYRAVVDPTPVLDKTVPGGFITKQEAIKRTYDAIGAVAGKIESNRLLNEYMQHPPIVDMIQKRFSRVGRTSMGTAQLVGICPDFSIHDLNNRRWNAPNIFVDTHSGQCTDPNCVCHQQKPIMIDVQKSFADENSKEIKPILRNSLREERTLEEIVTVIRTEPQEREKSVYEQTPEERRVRELDMLNPSRRPKIPQR